MKISWFVVNDVSASQSLLVTSHGALHPSLANRFINLCGLCCPRVRMGFFFPCAEYSRSQAYFIFFFFFIPCLVIVAHGFMTLNLGCHSKVTSTRQGTPLAGVFELMHLELRIGLSHQCQPSSEFKDYS